MLAVHNSARFLEDRVRRLCERLHRVDGAEIILVENGSADASRELTHDLARRYSSRTVAVRAAHSAPGLGNALRRGLALSHGRLVVVVGAELPFGFTDLDAWQAMPTPPAVVIGSKSHPRSRGSAGLGRRFVSFAFRQARRVLLGIARGDTQGSILVDGALARRIQPHLVCGGYLVTTEICAWARLYGAEVAEVPVRWEDAEPSTVSPLRDGLRMLTGMVALRRRLRAATAAVVVPQP